jgi:hypothetical protein
LTASGYRGNIPSGVKKIAMPMPTAEKRANMAGIPRGKSSGIELLCVMKLQSASLQGERKQI